MSKKNEKKEKLTDKVKTKITDEIVLVRVVNNFRDCTDNERFISAGPNSFYRTNKTRADKLVAAGYCEYQDLQSLLLNEVEEPNAQANGIEDPNAQANEDEEPNAQANEVEDPNE